MIEIYDHNNKNYDMNGDMPLQPTSCTLIAELNGIFEIELIHPLDSEGRWEYIKVDSVVACPTPYSDKQLFRIYDVDKGMNDVVAKARHVFWDLVDHWLEDVRPTQKDGLNGLRDILAYSGFVAHSDIDKISTAYYVRKNGIEAIMSSDDNSFLKRWGGEIYLDNFDVYINKQIGGDYGVSIDYGKNMTSIQAIENIDEVATRIVPVGYDGIMLNKPNNYVDSSLINKYARIKTREVKFDDIKVRGEYEDEGFNTLSEAQAEMVKRCNKLYEGGIDIPKCNYTVTFVNLANTAEYKENGLENLEKINLGDTVKVTNTKIGIDIKARCIKYSWNCISNRYISQELGNFIENYFDGLSDVTNRVDSILKEIVDPNGNLDAQKIVGFINSTKAKIKAQRDIAEPQHVRAMQFVDTVPGSPTYGSVLLGTQGLMVSQQRTLDNKDWDYTTAITAEGIIADKIIGNFIASSNGVTQLNMKTGELSVVQENGGVMQMHTKGLRSKGSGSSDWSDYYTTQVFFLEARTSTDGSFSVSRNVGKLAYGSTNNVPCVASITKVTLGSYLGYIEAGKNFSAWYNANTGMLTVSGYYRAYGVTSALNDVPTMSSNYINLDLMINVVVKL